jgi:pilus assembly protein CpaB
MRLFEGVRVIAVNRTGNNRGSSGTNHVTLELTEPQVNIVTLARDRGTITLSYNPNGRGDGGLALSSADRVTLYEILGLKEADPPAEPFMTEIYRGGGRSTNHFNDRGKLIESYQDRSFYDRTQQEKRLVPNAAPAPNKTPAPPVRPTDGQNGDQRTPPTALRTFLNQQAK